VRVPEADRVAEQGDEEIHALYPLAQARSKEALRPQHKHQEERRESDAAAGAAAQRDEGEDLDHAQQVAADDRAGDAAHTAEHDHGETAHLDVVAPDVGADVAKSDAKKDSSESAQS